MEGEGRVRWRWWWLGGGGRKKVMHRDLAAQNVLVQSIDPVHVKVREWGAGAKTACQGGEVWGGVGERG